jgi:hypothetical protein
MPMLRSVSSAASRVPAIGIRASQDIRAGDS